MGRRSDHTREEIREMALDAAEEILESGDPSALSARRIAAHIGYTVGTLYLVFRNLDDLIVHLNARTLDELYQDIGVRCANAAGTEQAVRAIGRAYAEFSERHQGRWSQLFRLRNEEDELPQWYLDKVRRLFALLEEQLAGLCRGSDAEQAARALWGGVHGICLLHRAGLIGLGQSEPDAKTGGSTEPDVHAYTQLLIGGFLAGLGDREENTVS